MRTSIALIAIFMATVMYAQKSHTWPVSAYHCAPWDMPSTSEDPNSESACYFNSSEWTPWYGNIIKDFMSADVPSFMDKPSRQGWSTEHTVNHWAISYKEMFGYAGDCGGGTWLIRERNIFHIPSMLPEMYQNLNVFNCNGTYDIKITMNKQYQENIDLFNEGKPLKEVTGTEDYHPPKQFGWFSGHDLLPEDPPKEKK